MNPQIEQLRKQFNGYNNAQKKQFIDNLKAKLKTNNNADYSRFLNECVQNYNASLKTGSSLGGLSDFDDLLDGGGSVSGIHNLAEPSQRLVAYILDWVLLLGVWLVIGIPTQLIATFFSDLPVILVLVVIAIIVATYLGIQLSNWKKGTTWGKKRMKLYVVHKTTGKPLSFGSMFLREGIGKWWISGLVAGLGYIWILIDKDKQGWHDKLVSSIVIKK